MTKKSLLPAISSDALLGKSKLYVHRALAAKGDGDLDQYQLWASLALELLGKAALSGVHPSLVVDPTHFQSLFAASGINLSTDIKTIAAHTLFERLRYVVPGFGESSRKFCEAIAQRRNAELHSGETPFRAMRLDAWEGRYWHAAQLILEFAELTLEQWLGADQARAPKALLKQVQQAEVEAASIRVEESRERFSKLKKKEREELLRAAKSLGETRRLGLFSFDPDMAWVIECPACGGNGVLAGVQVEEEVLDQKELHDDDIGALGWHEEVERRFSAEEYHCPACNLHLNSQEEIEGVGIDVDHTTTEWREFQYEPEYMNE